MALADRLLSVLLPCGRVLPPGFAWRLGGMLGDAYARLPGRDQRRCREHLARAFPELDAERVTALARRCFRHFGAMGMWTLATLQRDPRVLASGIAVEGVGNFQETWRACRRGEGTVIVAGHLGNWELLARVASCILPSTVLGRRMRHPQVDAIIQGMRGQFARTLYQEDGIRACLRELGEGRLMATLPDQDVPRLSGCFVPWFGELAYTPSGPAAIAAIARCPIQPVYCFRRGDRWVIHWGPRRHLPTGERSAASLAITAWYTAYQEAVVRHLPWQWAWWHRRWRTRPEDRPDAPVFEKQEEGEKVEV